MNAPSFFTKLLRKVVRPKDKTRAAERKARKVIALCHALLSERGEVSGATLARDALAAYEELPANSLRPIARPRFFSPTRSIFIITAALQLKPWLMPKSTLAATTQFQSGA